jgi:putative endonuclease
MPGSENSTAIMFYYVYILQSIKNKDLYIGYTIDLRKRLKEHNRGLNFSTKPHIPWQLIFFEAYRNKEDAKRREKYLKTNQGSRLLKRMLKEYFYHNKLLKN